MQPGSRAYGKQLNHAEIQRMNIQQELEKTLKEPCVSNANEMAEHWASNAEPLHHYL